MAFKSKIHLDSNKLSKLVGKGSDTQLAKTFLANRKVAGLFQKAVKNAVNGKSFFGEVIVIDGTAEWEVELDSSSLGAFLIIGGFDEATEETWEPREVNITKERDKAVKAAGPAKPVKERDKAVKESNIGGPSVKKVVTSTTSLANILSKELDNLDNLDDQDYYNTVSSIDMLKRFVSSFKKAKSFNDLFGIFEKYERELKDIRKIKELNGNKAIENAIKNCERDIKKSLSDLKNSK